MAADLLASAFFSVLDLLRASAFSLLPALVLALVVRALRRWLAETKGWSWLKSAFVATFIVLALLVNLVYWPDWISTLGKATYGEVPPQFQYTLPENLFGYAVNLVRLLFVSLLLALLALPIELVALALKEHAERRHGLHGLLALALGLYGALFLTWAAVLFLFPWAISGLLYLVFFGFG